MSAQFLTLGLIGTVFGFVFCLKDGFDSVVATNPQTIQILLNQVSKGMGTALWTTIFGLLAALPIKFMLFYYETLIKKELNAD
jgi:biopolymer transport protein ExbB/TolQ